MWSFDALGMFPGLHLFPLHLPNLQQVAWGHAGLRRWFRVMYHHSIEHMEMRLFSIQWVYVIFTLRHGTQWHGTQFTEYQEELPCGFLDLPFTWPLGSIVDLL